MDQIPWEEKSEMLIAKFEPGHGERALNTGLLSSSAGRVDGRRRQRRVDPLGSGEVERGGTSTSSSFDIRLRLEKAKVKRANRNEAR